MLRLAATAARTRALSTTTKPWFRAAGEGTLILRFGNGIDEATNKKVLRRLDALGEKPRGVTDAVPAYASLAVHYDCTEISRDDVETWINEAASREDDGDVKLHAATVAESITNWPEVVAKLRGTRFEKYLTMDGSVLP